MNAEFYSTRTAAAYLGVKPETIKYHVHVVKDLIPDQRLGNTLIFTRATLDRFRETKRPIGRPSKSAA
jgi:hypothetical protein